VAARKTRRLNRFRPCDARYPSRSSTVAKCDFAIDDNIDTARDRIADALERRSSYFELHNLAVAVVGTADDCIVGLRRDRRSRGARNPAQPSRGGVAGATTITAALDAA
jgi:hypothetical protein